MRVLGILALALIVGGCAALPSGRPTGARANDVPPARTQEVEMPRVSSPTAPVPSDGVTPRATGDLIFREPGGPSATATPFETGQDDAVFEEAAFSRVRLVAPP